MPPTASPSAPQPVTLEQKMMLLGEATLLLLQSPRHRGYALHQLDSYVLTPLRLGQFQIYRSRRGPVGFVAWAFLEPETARAYAAGDHELEPADWRAGDELWFIEFIAPAGHAATIVRDLRRRLFPDAQARSLRRYVDGRAPRIVHWWGATAAGDRPRRRSPADPSPRGATD